MLNRTFTEIVSNIGNNVQDTETTFKTILKNYVNDIYFDILRRVNIQSINDYYNFNTVAGTKDYVLPNNFGKELYVQDTTNLQELPYISLQELIDSFPSSIDSQGVVERYSILRKPVRAQPSSASILSIVSSSALDTSQSIRITGEGSSGEEIAESVTLTGTTTATTSNSYTYIRSISKSGTTTGKVTITSNSGAVTVAVLSYNQQAYSCMAMRLHYTPSGVINIKCPYIVSPAPLVNDYDFPVIDCADIIELGATAKAWRYKRQFMKAQEMQKLYEQGIVSLMWDQENSMNRTQLFNPKPYNREDMG